MKDTEKMIREYRTRGKWAIPQAPRCHLKRHAVNRNYRNDWCEYGGKCHDCPIARCYIEEGFDINTTGWRSTRTLEEEGARLVI